MVSCVRLTAGMRVVLLPTAVVLCAPRGGLAAPTFGLSGSDEMLWAWQSLPEPGAELPRIIFAYRQTSTAEPVFYRLPFDLFGQVRQTAALRAELTVFFGDGSHQRYRIPAGRSPVVVLPKRAVPAALCADAAEVTLFAAVRAEIVVELLSTPQAPQEDDDGTSMTGNGAKESPPAEDAPSSEGAVIRAASLPANAAALVRYDEGRWIYDRDLPAEVDPDRPLWIVACNRTVTCLFAPSASAPVRWSESSGGDWSPPAPADTLHANEIIAALLFGPSRAKAQRSAHACEQPVIVALQRDKREAAPMLRLFRLVDEAWRAGQTLNDANLPSNVRSDDLAATTFGQRIALARLDSQGQVLVGYWPADGGAPESAPQVVPALKPLPRPLLGPDARTFVAGVLLVVVGTMVFALRREHVMQPAPLQPGQAAARPLRRLIAFVIDLLIAAPLIYGSFIPWMESLTTTAALDPAQVGTLDRAASVEIYFWPIVLSTIVFSVYATVFEAAMGATPGKRLMACRVVDEHGQRCRFRAIVLRNLLRPLEFYPSFDFIPPLALMLFTRNRQRLGDLAAGTIVVQPAPTETPPDASRDDRAGQDSNLRPRD